MRAVILLVAAALGASAACMGSERGAKTTVTSASQGATMTGTGATGGSTPETDMQGTGRASGVVVVPRDVPGPPPELPPLPPSSSDDAAAPPPPSSYDAGPGKALRLPP